jgi:cytochrome b561
MNRSERRRLACAQSPVGYGLERCRQIIGTQFPTMRHDVPLGGPQQDESRGTTVDMTLGQRYNATAKWLHWLIALGMVYTFGIGWIMTSMVGITPAKLKYFSWHKWAGVTIFVVAIGRILWRLAVPPGALPASITGLHRRASVVMHDLLYLSTLFVPVTGYLYSLAVGYPIVYLGLVELPVVMGKNPHWAEPLRLAHAWSSYLMAAAVVAHAAAALLHHFYYRDSVLSDMLPQRVAYPFSKKESSS